MSLTEELDQDVLRRRLLCVLQQGFVEIRALTCDAVLLGQTDLEIKRINDLSDILHNVPHWLITCRPRDIDWLQDALESYERRYASSTLLRPLSHGLVLREGALMHGSYQLPLCSTEGTHSAQQ
jgi:hypothetical protein